MERRLTAATALTVLLSLLLSAPRLLKWRPAGGGEAGDGGSLFSLGPEAVRDLQVYRLVTYIFAYDDPVSWLCGAVIAWYFAGGFEKTVGTAKHAFLTLAFAAATALLYLSLQALSANLWEVADAQGFAPVAFAMLAASVARSPMKRTPLLGVNLRVALVPWLLLGVARLALVSTFLPNLCGLLTGSLYGYGFCSCADLPESAVSRLDQKFPFRLLKRIPGLQYVPGSLAERRASHTRKLNPVPGSYPTQSYHRPPPPPPAFFAVPAQHPDAHLSNPRPASSPGPGQLPSAGASVEPGTQSHVHAPLGSFPPPLHLGGSPSWGSVRTSSSGVPQAPGFPAAGAALESAELCRVHVG